MPVEHYRAYGARIVPIYDTSRGGFDQEQFSNTEPGVVLPRPAGGGRGPIRELGRFYEMLRDGGSLDGARILRSDMTGHDEISFPTGGPAPRADRTDRVRDKNLLSEPESKRPERGPL